MHDTIPLGRIAGVRVGVNWSMLVVFALIAASLADEQFPQEAPGQARWVYWGLAAAASVVFYASLLAHELGHAVVARRRGVEVEGITLWLFGGVARLRGEAMTPGAEARIAIAGPVVTFVLTAVFAAVAVALARSDVAAVAVVVPAWLAVINLALGVFNLVPAFPLDGGRVLRAILWARRGDRVAATRSAALAGRGFGYLLVVIGVLEFFGASGLGGLWFVFLGWFLLAAATAEATEVITRARLEGVPVRAVMTPDPVVAPAWMTVDAFIEAYLLGHRVSAFPLRDVSGTLVGLLTLAEIRAVPRSRRGEVHVGDVATPLERVPSGRPDEPLLALLERMRGAGGRALVFDDAGNLCGIVSPSDVARAIQSAELSSGTRPAA